MGPRDVIDWLGDNWYLLLIVFVAVSYIGGFVSAAVAAPKPPTPPQIGTCGVRVCSVQLEDGTRCVLTTAGGLDCDWGEK